MQSSLNIGYPDIKVFQLLFLSTLALISFFFQQKALAAEDSNQQGNGQQPNTAPVVQHIHSEISQLEWKLFTTEEKEKPKYLLDLAFLYIKLGELASAESYLHYLNSQYKTVMPSQIMQLVNNTLAHIKQLRKKERKKKQETKAPEYWTLALGYDTNANKKTAVGEIGVQISGEPLNLPLTENSRSIASAFTSIQLTQVDKTASYSTESIGFIKITPFFTTGMTLYQASGLETSLSFSLGALVKTDQFLVKAQSFYINDEQNQTIAGVDVRFNRLEHTLNWLETAKIRVFNYQYLFAEQSLSNQENTLYQWSLGAGTSLAKKPLAGDDLNFINATFKLKRHRHQFQLEYEIGEQTKPFNQFLFGNQVDRYQKTTLQWRYQPDFKIDGYPFYTKLSYINKRAKIPLNAWKQWQFAVAFDF